MANLNSTTLKPLKDYVQKDFIPNKRNAPIPSLIKWTGSKRVQANIINSYFPEYNRYFEPFLGAGYLLYLNNHKIAFASDIYEPLIKLWLLIRDHKNLVIDSYTNHWEKLQKDFPDYYYIIRDRFNSKQNPLDLLFLTRTCVNGIVRFNKNGNFNNSLHLSRRGMIPDKFIKIVNLWSSVITNVQFDCADFSDTVNQIQKGDFVYLDPPYAGNKQRYITNIRLEEFYNYLEKINSIGARFALSFDGFRNGVDLTKPIPKELYKRRLLISSGISAVKRVLDKKKQKVEESLYLNY